MKSQLINSMLSFTLGTGASLLGLAMWTGSTDLDQIKQSVQYYVAESEDHASALLSDYNVTVDNANAEIGEYKEALAQANSNITQLITAYEKEQAQAEQDLADLEKELADMQTRLDQQYETDMNVIIDQANTEIESANQEVSDTRVEVAIMIEGSQVDEIVNGEKSQLDTTGDKSVTSIEGIIGEVEGEVVEGE